MRSQRVSAANEARPRAGVVAVAVAVALASTLIACGGSGGSGDSSDAGEGTVTVEHRYGATDVPAQPERVVSLDMQWTDVLLALDAPPVGYLGDPAVEGDLPWRGDGLADATRIDAVDTLPYEQIAALRPDLIMVTYFATDSADYDRLSAIAPTIPTLSENQVDSWQDIARAAGRVLDAHDEAEALITEVDREVAALGAELPGLDGKTFALANVVPGDAVYVVADPDDGANVLFDRLGLELSPTFLDVASNVSGRVELSLEQVGLLDADLLVLFTNGSDPTDLTGYAQLPAVAAGAVAVLDYAEVSGLNTPTPLSVPYSLGAIRPALDAAAT
jgi:iron complex transport system substrate-binding protein